MYLWTGEGETILTAFGVPHVSSLCRVGVSCHDGWSPESNKRENMPFSKIQETVLSYFTYSLRGEAVESTLTTTTPPSLILPSSATSPESRCPWSASRRVSAPSSRSPTPPRPHRAPMPSPPRSSTKSARWTGCSSWVGQSFWRCCGRAL